MFKKCLPNNISNWRISVLKNIFLNGFNISSYSRSDSVLNIMIIIAVQRSPFSSQIVVFKLGVDWS
jgi:hypothetical protein